MTNAVPPIHRTEGGPTAFIRELEDVIDGLRCGRIVGVSCVYDGTVGIGRVAVTTVDGSSVIVDPDLAETTPPTAPGRKGTPS